VPVHVRYVAKKTHFEWERKHQTWKQASWSTSGLVTKQQDLICILFTY